MISIDLVNIIHPILFPSFIQFSHIIVDVLLSDPSTDDVVGAVVLAEPTIIVEKVLDVVPVIASAEDEVTAFGQSIVN